MKNTILLAFLLAAGLALVHAQEAAAEKLTLPLFPQYDALTLNFASMTLFPGYDTELNLTPYAYPASFGGKLGMGFLNILLGLGSWISGDWQNGILITLMQGGGIALTIWGISLWQQYHKGVVEEIFLWWMNPGFWLVITGPALWGYGIFHGLLAPFKAPKTARLNDPRNWAAAFFPTPNGGVAGTLAFTAWF